MVADGDAASDPQHHASPSVERAHADAAPIASSAKRTPLGTVTCTGVSDEVVLPVPN